ncbi:unnamed protein product [Leuciscus chuanchicus]
MALAQRHMAHIDVLIKLPVWLDTEAAVDGSVNNFIQWLYQQLVVRDRFEALPTLTENNLGPNTVTGNWPAQQEAGEEELPYPAEALLTLLAAGPCLLTTLQVMKEHFLLHNVTERPCVGQEETPPAHRQTGDLSAWCRYIAEHEERRSRHWRTRSHTCAPRCSLIYHTRTVVL